MFNEPWEDEDERSDAEIEAISYPDADPYYADDHWSQEGDWKGFGTSDY